MKVHSTNIEEILEDAAKRLESHHPENLEWAAFPQTWSSTALGFGGIGGQAMTGAQTFIVSKYPFICAPTAVYFGGRFAYLVQEPNEKFFEDIRNFRMLAVNKAGQYEKVTDDVR